jgi:hypothetical protein
MHRYWSRQEKCLTLCSPSHSEQCNAARSSAAGLPWFISGPRDGRHHGFANAAIRVEIETRPLARIM